MLKPIVGVTTSLDPGERLREGVDYAYLKRSYARAIARAGGTPMLLTPDADVSELAARCHGFVISGGDDLPARLAADGTVPRPTAPGSEPEQAERIAWERRLLEAAQAAQRPVLGVCYGMQLLNLHRGGTLHESFESALDHGGGGRFTEHAVTARSSHPGLAGLAATAEVSSSHRQCVDRVASGLEVLAEAPDGVIEAIGAGDWLGVEWHPEQDASGAAIYGWLVARAGEGARR